MQINQARAKSPRFAAGIRKLFSLVFESRVATVGFCMVMFWVAMAFVSLFWTPHDPNGLEFAQNLPPNFVNPLGTDHMGRDILSRLMQGTQVVLLKTRLPFSDWSIPGGVAIWGVIGSLSLGTFLGLNAGYRRGWWDQVIMQVLDALIAFPRIVLYLVVIAALGQGDLVVILAIAVTGAPGVGRLARSLTLDIQTRDYIRAAETRAESKTYIMFQGNPSQRQGAASGGRHDSGGIRHFHDRHPGISGHRPAAARSGLGQHGQRGTEIYVHQPCGGDLAVIGHRHPGDRAEPVRRRSSGGDVPIPEVIPLFSFRSKKSKETTVTPDPSQSPVLKIQDLAVAYKVRGGEVEAVRNVSFQIRKGESYGIVGESGCGKSTVAWSIINFLGANGYIKRGSIKFRGEEMKGRSGEALRKIRGSNIGMIYQDPMQSLNPSLRIGLQMKEVLTVHQKMSDSEAERHCVKMLEKVHMPDPESVMRRYPHQISGGQQQRVVIAMALLNNPALLIMDEPTTALDVTVEAAVLDLVEEVKREFDTAIMFITHNLGVVARVCSKVGVMYAGEMVERATVHDLFKDPKHPYTQGLIRCVPKLGTDKTGSALHPIRGRVPSPNNRPSGCIFWPRCDHIRPECKAEHPRAAGHRGIGHLCPGAILQK